VRSAYTSNNLLLFIIRVKRELRDDNGTGRLPDDGCRRRVGKRPGPPAGETYSQISPSGDLYLHYHETTGTGNTRPNPLNDREQSHGIGK
jgi:hypothetical protein